MTPIILLVITIVMPGKEPDVWQSIEEPSLEQCWKDADEFVRAGLPPSIQDAEGLKAACQTKVRRT